MKDAFLIDTNVLSELARPEPAARVVDWFRSLERPVTSSVCVYELSRGVELLRPGRRRTFLEAWLAELLNVLEVCDFDAGTALHAAGLEARVRAEGRSVEVRDLFIAASAARTDRVLASRNLQHLSGLGCLVLDPFTGARTR